MGRVDRWRADRRPPIGDLVLALGCVLVGQQEVWFPPPGFAHQTGPRPVESLTYLVSAGALVWRRSRPLAVVVVATASLSAFELAFGSPDGLGPLVPLAVALYAAGRYAAPRQFALATALTTVAVVVHEMRDAQFVLDGQAVMAWGAIAAAGAVGQSLALAAARVAAARREAERTQEKAESDRQRAVVDERARIARDLHDLVGHGLSLIVLQLTAMKATGVPAYSDPVSDRLETLGAVARSTLAEMRRLVAASDVDEAALTPQPRLADLSRLVQDVRRCGFPVELAVSVRTQALAPGVEVTVFRVAQEALTNVIRHAEMGAQVVVAIGERDGAVVVGVRNDGSVMPADLVPGRGITGMRERVALYGGRLDVGPRPEGAFVVEATLPLGVGS